MFDKITFAKKINQIKELYPTQEEFCKQSGIGRTSISQYMNAKLESPPKPQMLDKIALASHGLVTYNELMCICGYTTPAVTAFLDFSTDNEKKALKSIVLYAHQQKLQSNMLLNDITILKYLNCLSETEKEVTLGVAREILYNPQYISIKSSIILDKKDSLGNPVVTIPLLGTVKAGYDYMAQENWEGTVDVEKSIAGNGEDYFALRVKGDSMFPVLVENDIVVVKRQNDFENGDIVVAIINGDEATIKKAKKSEAGILLQPFNNNYEPLIFTNEDIRNLPVIIIGIVKQLKREF